MVISEGMSKSVSSEENDGISRSFEKLQQQFNTFYANQAVLKDSYNRIASCFQLLEGDDDCEGLKVVFTEGTSAIEGIINKDPIILVSGQVNCGKSSFINLLLNRTVVPVKANPCTARIVRIKYCDEEYYQLTDVLGRQKGPKCLLDKKCLRKEIEVNEGRENKDTVEDVVEIGIDSPLLQSGLQIIDTPGLGENKALDAVVNECLGGVLQVLFYVIDGNTAWRLQDAEFICEIERKFPDMKIIYVCNKCEEDATARAFDVSDEDEDSDSSVDEQPTEPKGKIVFRKLLNSCLLRNDDDIHCNRFFQISCVRLKRRSKDYDSTDEYHCEYQRLINSLCGILRHFLYFSLRRAVGMLFSIVTKCYDKCQKHERQLEAFKQPSLLDYFEETFHELFSVVHKYKDILKEAVAEVRIKKKDEIIEESTARLKDIFLGGKSHQRGYYTVLVSLSNLAAEIASDETVHHILGKMVSNIQEVFSDFRLKSEVVAAHGDMPVLLQTFDAIFQEADERTVFSNFVRLFMYGRIDQIVNRFNERTLSNVILSVDKALTLFDQSYHELVDTFCLKITDELSAVGDSLRMNCKLAQFVKVLEENSAFSIEVRRSFGKESVILQSLLSTLEHREVNLLGIVGEGSRCRIYKGKRGNMVFAARRTIRDENSQDFKDMAQTYVSFRDCLSKDHLNIMKPFDVGRDITGQVLVLVPYIENDLFIELCHDEGMIERQPEDRLAIGLQIVKGCLFLKEMGFKAVDLRPNNIRLQLDGCPKIDISKWQGLHTPYPRPDNKPPFHFSPDSIIDNQRCCLPSEDVYGCGILIWMLACGSFVRPAFACRRITTDIAYVEVMSETSGIPGSAYTEVNLSNAVHRPASASQVQQELTQILKDRCTHDPALGPYVSLVKGLLDKCIREEADRVNVEELHDLFQSQIAVLV